MKICIVVDNVNSASGWGRLANELKKSLEKKGYQIGLITQTENNNNSSNILNVALRNFSLRKPRKFFSTIYKIRKFITVYDVVFCFDANPYGIIISIALLGSKTRYILYSLGSYSLLTKKIFRDVLIRFAYWKAEKVVFVSDFLRSQVEKSGLTIQKFSILPVGVNQDYFYPVDTPYFSDNNKYILGVGAIKKRKGFHLSIDAFYLIAKENESINYIIVGRGEGDLYEDSLKEKVIKYNLEKRVIFLENISDSQLRSLYSFSEFFLLTPITDSQALEGFGMVYLEAASCGKTSIGTIDSGAEAAILNNETGLTVNPNPEEISQAIIKLINDRNLRDRLTINAKKRSNDFSWKNVSDNLMEILNSKQ